MGYHVKKIAVLGAGTMGSQIAALIANSDMQVFLFDKAAKAPDRAKIARDALERLKKGRVFHGDEQAEYITPATMEDDLHKLREVDWVIECVPEDKHIKQETYRNIAPFLKQGAVVSSNTSTILLQALKEGMDEGLKHKLCITHFFNPPTKMALLEVVAGQDSEPEALKHIKQFADTQLGKHVVEAKDTPGFIANRIGIFWMLCGMKEAQKQGISIETADKVMNGAFGFPKTGIFGLMDLIGLALIPEMADSISVYLDEHDDFRQIYDGAPLIRKLIEQGYTGKEKGGFYRENEGGKQALELETGEYRRKEEPDIIIRNWQAFLEKDVPESRFACDALVRTLAYAAKTAPDIAENIRQIDSAMCEGYHWQKGPFELMDALGVDWLIAQVQKRGDAVSKLLQQAQGKGFYRESASRGMEYLTFSGKFQSISPEPDKWTLAIRTAGQTPLLQNDSATLWDVGDNIACLSFTKGRLHVMDERGLELLDKSVDKVMQECAGLIIGHDGTHFTAGLDLKQVLGIAESKDWTRLERILRNGQEAMFRLKTSAFPKVVALSGYVLGGGCELTLHCDAAQAYMDTRIGLVETGIGVIPAWGGSKETLFRILRQNVGNDAQATDALAESFRTIALAKKSAYAKEAFDMEYLNARSRISRNRERLLPDAKALCRELVKGYAPPEPFAMEVPVKAFRQRLQQELKALREQVEFSVHQEHVLHVLVDALSGFAAAGKQHGEEHVRLTEQDVLDSTRHLFVELVKTEGTRQMIRQKV